MSYIKMQKIQKELVDTPEKGYIYFGFDDNDTNGKGFWIKNDNGLESHYVFNFSPSISSFEPDDSVEVYQTLIIYGTNFLTGTTSVTLGGNIVPEDSITILNPNKLSLIVPNTPGNNIPVVVSTIQYGSSQPVNYTITSV